MGANSHAIMTRPAHLNDPVLRASPQLFATVCFPVRVLLAFFLIFSSASQYYVSPPNIKFVSWTLLLIAAGLAVKWRMNPTSWKNYARPVFLYSLMGAILMQPSMQNVDALQKCGFVLLIDALLGQECHYIAETYFVS